MYKRQPLSSQNPMLTKIVGDKPKLMILNKVDLADPVATKEWQEYFESQGIRTLSINSKEQSTVKKAVSYTHLDVYKRQGLALAETVVETLETSPANYSRLYDNDLSVEEKITKIAQEIYRADNVVFEKKAKTQIAQIVKNGWDKLPVCMAKTQYSFSDDPSLLGAPSGFDITIRELVPKTGAGFIVALTGEVMTMPGLPKRPAALNMDVAEDGTALGLF